MTSALDFRFDNNSQVCYTIFVATKQGTVMKFTELTDHEIWTMLADLQDLVDGSFLYVEEIVEQSGVQTGRAFQILDSINLLKSLTLK